MRRLLVISATTAAVLAIGGTALAANGPGSGSGSGSGPGRHDDDPARVVVDDSATRGTADDNPTPHGSRTPGGTPSAGPSMDDHGGLRGGHGSDDPAGDDHGGSRHRH
ncbi:hypothetical protein [Dactylosporangium sp. NPDC048998]|uniref:hypothetical protein n=1 Tax=Dactylosporangium sp. NPDC048998 TaxID=3363976 RepID=UPI00371C91FF